MTNNIPPGVPEPHEFMPGEPYTQQQDATGAAGITIEEINRFAFEAASETLADRVRHGVDFQPMVHIQDAEGGSVAFLLFTDEGDDKLNWRELMTYAVKVFMCGFARAEYLTFVSDAHFKVEKSVEKLGELERGDLGRMREAGDDSIGDGLMVLTYGRDDFTTKLVPYRITKKRNIKWLDDFDNDATFGGSMHRTLSEAATGRRLLDIIREEMGLDSTDDVWETIGGEGALPLPAVRAHQDMGTLRAVIEQEEMSGRITVIYFPEDDDAAEVAGNSLARMAEWNPNLMTARSHEEMNRKMRG